MLKKMAMTTLFASSLLLAESGVGININEKDLEVEGILDSRNLAILQTSSTIYQADFNFINVDSEKKLLGAGLGATNKLEGVEGIELTFGAKFIWADDNLDYTDNFLAVPLMAKVRYNFPPLLYNIPPVAVESKVLYAPKVLGFGDAENYSEFRVSADIEMIEQVRVYVGYRNIKTKYNNFTESILDNSFYAGLKVSY
jgi:hypothetical protein